MTLAATPSDPRSRLLARCTFATAPRIDCAVSGGPDSVALLALAAATGAEVVAHHVDHCLRPGSAAEAELVAAAADRFGAGFVRHRVDVAAGPNLEARARAARFDALPPHVATGHTADDQAETVLLNLLRGSGVDGLGGMVPGPRHPLLGLRRSETHALCTALGMRTAADVSNQDPRFRRNRVRHELLPLIAAIAERDPVPLLVRHAELARDDRAVLEAAAAEIDPTDARAVTSAPPALARRAIRRWLRPELEGYAPDAAAVERVLAVARGEVRAAEVAGGVRVERHRGRLVLGLGH